MEKTKKIFDVPNFTDRTKAEKEARKAKIRMSLASIGFVTGLFYQSVMLIFLFFYKDVPKWLRNVVDSDIVGVITLVCLVITAVLGVGIVDLVKVMAKIIVVSFWIIPIIPINLLCLFAGIMIAPLLFLYFPMIYVIVHYVHIRKIYKAAMEYLSLEQTFVNPEQAI